MGNTNRKKSNLNDLKDKLKPMIIINENAGDSLYVIIDFSLPSTNLIRRLIAKKLKNGNISSVTYSGIVGPDRTCTSKWGAMGMDDVPKDKFWMMIRALEELYKAKDGTIEIRKYDGKSMQEAAALMKKYDNATVWESHPDVNL